MKKYKVNVNGNEYEIAIELMDENEVKSAPQKAEQPKAAAQPKGEGATVNSPMPGTILDIKVSNGATVKKGQILMILEAMKMENEIMAPCDGTVTSVNVTKGAAVQTGACLCTIK